VAQIVGMDVELERGIRIGLQHDHPHLIGIVDHAGRHGGHQVAELEIDFVGIPPRRGDSGLVGPVDPGGTDDSRIPASRNSVTQKTNKPGSEALD
jgi:hypothetical protein